MLLQNLCDTRLIYSVFFSFGCYLLPIISTVFEPGFSLEQWTVFLQAVFSGEIGIIGGVRCCMSPRSSGDILYDV
jgi:hypothetical protein